jgi:hypothetical protein
MVYALVTVSVNVRAAGLAMFATGSAVNMTAMVMGDVLPGYTNNMSTPL